jgi:hypothetical protein
MEGKKTIQELIDALKALQLQEATLTEQLEEAIENEHETRRGEQRHESAAPTRETIRLAAPQRNFLNGDYLRGDRIWIKNKIQKPASWDNRIAWFERDAKTATVTKVVRKGSFKQIHFITDNGIHTWRAPNNVCLLETSEITR